MAQTFAATVDEWVRSSQERMLAVFQTAVQFTFGDVQDRIPVDTGFLRASFRATTGEPQIASSRNPYPSQKAKGLPPVITDYPDVITAIVGLELGDTIYGTFSANYAGPVEYGARGRPGIGMVRLSAQNWQANVDRATSELRAR